ncbi:MAG: exosortase/archaeosortase family protein [Kiritimatiellia bacterium]
MFSGSTQKIRRSLSDIAPAACICVLLVLLYGVHGNNQEVEFHGRSAVLWMVKRWIWAGGDFSHVWLIPLVSLFALWRKRKELAHVPGNVSYAGLAVVAASLLLHWMGFRAQLTRLSLLSMIGLLWGIPFYLYGRHVAALLLFPCGYLIFCIPLSFLNNFTVPLRLMASSAATHVLNGFGIPAVRSGTLIESAAGGGFSFNVADPCSGLRSLLAMTALTAAYAYFTQKTFARKTLLFLSAVPIAIFGNVTRIVIVGVTAQGFGRKTAEGLYHKGSGLIVFAVAILLMMGTGYLLKTHPIEKLRQWKRSDTDTA